MTIITTHRLLLRQVTLNDTKNLLAYFNQTEVMKFSSIRNKQKTIEWIKWNTDNYKKYGFGKWGIILKENNEFIGDCGITYQNIAGEMLPEIGYRLNKIYWHNGYALEAAKACKKYAFEKLGLNEIYSYMDKDNLSSIKIAERNGMKLIKEYIDEIAKKTIQVYGIKK